MMDAVIKVLMWGPKERAKFQRGDLFGGTSKGKRGRRDYLFKQVLQGKRLIRNGQANRRGKRRYKDKEFSKRGAKYGCASGGVVTA